MRSEHADYWITQQWDRETQRRIEAGRQVEREMIEDAERARDGLSPIVRPFREIATTAPRPQSPRQEIPDDPEASGRPLWQLRHPNSAICQLVQLWREGKFNGPNDV